VKNEDKPFDKLWPIVSGVFSATENPVQHCVLKSGKKGYQKPVSNPNICSGKLLPAPIPKQTKFKRKKHQIEAIGVNN
jgi:hypothetical protein